MDTALARPGPTRLQHLRSSANASPASIAWRMPSILRGNPQFRSCQSIVGATPKSLRVVRPHDTAARRDAITQCVQDAVFIRF